MVKSISAVTLRLANALTVWSLSSATTPTASLCGSAIEGVPQLVGQDPVRIILQVAVCNQIFVELFHYEQLFRLPT